MVLNIPSLKFKFYSFEKTPLKNGDTDYFGFVEAPLLRTYCYLSKNQIEEIKKHFKVKVSKEEAPKGLKPTLWAKGDAVKGKKYFNLGLLFLIRRQSSGAILNYKKYPFLQFVLSDKPEIFYGLKTEPYTYTKMDNFRFSDFNFDRNFERDTRRKENSFCYSVKDVSNSEDLTKLIFGNNYSSPLAKKLVMKNIIHSKHGSLIINYELVRIIQLLTKMFSNEFVLEILQNHLPKIHKSPFFKDFLYKSMHLEPNYSGLVKFILQFKTDNEKLRELLRFNVPDHILPLFSQVMKEPFDHFKPDVSNESDALYFFNNLSRDWGRLKRPNHELKVIKDNKFNEEIAAIDGHRVGEWNFKVAKDYYTLLQWGSDLRNCAGNYHNTPSYQEMLLVGIFKGDKIMYLASIKGDKEWRKIDQLEGFKRAIPKPEVLNVIFKPFIPFVKDPTNNLKDLKKGQSDDLF